MPYKNSYLLNVILILLLLTYGFLLTHKIDLRTADLGRHIKNGEVLLETRNFDVIKTNFYSYTETKFPVVNHHWLTGVIFYLVWKIAGFTGIHLFFIILSLAAFLIFFRIAKEKIGIGPASIIALIAIPLLAERTEIRPEVFSYLFSGIFLWALLKFRAGSLSFKKLALILIPAQIIWVNTHIFFFLGFVITGIFIFSDFKKITLLLFLLAAASLINPFGIWGLFEPFKILNEYGYSVAENKSVWFLENYGIQRLNFLIFKISLLLTAASFLVVIFKKQQSLGTLQNFFLGGVIALMAICQSRNIALFGFFFLPIISQNLADLKIESLSRFSKEIKYLAIMLILGTFLFLISTDLRRVIPYWGSFGIGLEKNTSAAAQFFKNKNLQGPIFNNYDIGSYLIFYLFPNQKVFVDNRPEAYSVDFFQKIYIPAQENDDQWNQLNKKYNFNAIIFNYRDLTPWGQKFLLTRSKDPLWKIVFTDDRVVIFVKK